MNGLMEQGIIYLCVYNLAHIMHILGLEFTFLLGDSNYGYLCSFKGFFPLTHSCLKRQKCLDNFVSIWLPDEVFRTI